MIKILNSFEELERGAAKNVVCLGNFDGLHRGHQSVIGLAAQTAKQQGQSLVVMTFSPHPREFLTGQRIDKLLLDSEKTELLKKLGADIWLNQKFDRDFSIIPAREFIEQILIQALKTSHLFVGRDFRFGFKAEGSHHELVKNQKFQTTICEDIQEAQASISSTRIRKLIKEGDLEGAQHLLGYPYFISSTQEAGNARGREIGFPTLNLKAVHKLTPASGVYVSVMEHRSSGAFLPSVCNIGSRPTFEAGESIEAHALCAWPEKLTSSPDNFWRFYFLQRLRSEKKFSSEEKLIKQIQNDCEAAQQYFISRKKFQTFLTTTQSNHRQILTASSRTKCPELFLYF